LFLRRVSGKALIWVGKCAVIHRDALKIAYIEMPVVEVEEDGLCSTWAGLFGQAPRDSLSLGRFVFSGRFSGDTVQARK
jgi:hypothetical protein